jgi:hypothetical protein
MFQSLKLWGLILLLLFLIRPAFANDGYGILHLEPPVALLLLLGLLVADFYFSFTVMYGVLARRRWYPADAKLAGWVFFLFFALCLFPPLLFWFSSIYYLFIILWVFWLIFIIIVLGVLTRRQREREGG